MKPQSWVLVGATALLALPLSVLPALVAGNEAKVGGVLSIPTPSAQAAQTGAAFESLSRMPLAFTANRGQWDERVRFRASAGGATIWFCRDGITYQFTHRIPRQSTPVAQPVSVGSVGVADMVPDSVETVVVRAVFVGADPNVALVGEGALEYRCNYFLGNDAAKWRTEVPNCASVVYRGVYPGVDVRYDGTGGVLTCAYAAASESDLTQVKFRYGSVASVAEVGLGQFRVETPWGTVFGPLPAGGTPAPTSAAVAARSGSVNLVYSTYLGGSGGEGEYGRVIAVDGAGSAYVTGTTGSSDFPAQNPYDGSLNGGNDVFVTKLSPAGSAVEYSTFLGGSDDDAGGGIAVDLAGNAFVTGETQSPDFPTCNPCMGFQGGSMYGGDAFVTKLSAAGNELVYSTYLGGGDYDASLGVAVDDAGSAYLTGRTFSEDFPIANPYQSGLHTSTYCDAFVTKLSSDGDSLMYSTYLGGSDHDEAYAIAVDEEGCAHVTGHTFSGNFPTVNPYQIYQGSNDVFVSKLSGAGNALVYSTYLGGSGGGGSFGIAVDGAGCAYVTGYTSASDFPTVNPYQTDQGAEDAFVVKLASDGDSLVYGTYLGGGNSDRGSGIVVDQGGIAYVTGFTYSPDFPTVDPYQTDQDTIDAFVAALSSDGSTLVYCTYFGGSASDAGKGIAVDQGGNVYVTGSTDSSDPPTQSSFDGSYNGQGDVFVVKFGAILDAVFEPESRELPPSSALQQNVPNPFNASTIIRFSLETGGPVELAIYNILGQRVTVHREADLPPGLYAYEWDGIDEAGRDVANGVYLYSLTTQRFREARKMILLK